MPNTNKTPPDDTAAAIAERVWALIAAHDSGVIRRAAKRIGVSQPSLFHIVRGSNLPSVDTLVKIADAYGVTTDWLLGRPLKGTIPMVQAVSTVFSALENTLEEMQESLSRQYGPKRQLGGLSVVGDAIEDVTLDFVGRDELYQLMKLRPRLLGASEEVSKEPEFDPNEPLEAPVRSLPQLRARLRRAFSSAATGAELDHVTTLAEASMHPDLWRLERDDEYANYVGSRVAAFGSSAEFWAGELKRRDEEVNADRRRYRGPSFMHHDRDSPAEYTPGEARERIRALRKLLTEIYCDPSDEPVVCETIVDNLVKRSHVIVPDDLPEEFREIARIFVAKREGMIGVFLRRAHGPLGSVKSDFQWILREIATKNELLAEAARETETGKTNARTLPIPPDDYRLDELRREVRVYVERGDLPDNEKEERIEELVSVLRIQPQTEDDDELRRTFPQFARVMDEGRRRRQRYLDALLAKPFNPAVMEQVEAELNANVDELEQLQRGRGRGRRKRASKSK